MPRVLLMMCGVEYVGEMVQGDLVVRGCGSAHGITARDTSYTGLLSRKGAVRLRVDRTSLRARQCQVACMVIADEKVRIPVYHSDWLRNVCAEVDIDYGVSGYMACRVRN